MLAVGERRIALDDAFDLLGGLVVAFPQDVPVRLVGGVQVVVVTEQEGLSLAHERPVIGQLQQTLHGPSAERRDDRRVLNDPERQDVGLVLVAVQQRRAVAPDELPVLVVEDVLMELADDFAQIVVVLVDFEQAEKLLRRYGLLQLNPEHYLLGRFRV